MKLADVEMMVKTVMNEDLFEKLDEFRGAADKAWKIRDFIEYEWNLKAMTIVKNEMLARMK